MIKLGEGPAPPPNLEGNMRFLLILILPIMIFSYEWSTPQLIWDSECGYSRFAFDYFDRVWCIFNVYADPCTVKAACYQDSLWMDPVTVNVGSSASGVGGFDAVRTSSGKLWALTCEESPARTAFYFDGYDWSDTFIIPGLVTGCSGYRIAADSVDKVWAVFNGFEDWRIWCDFCEDTIWLGPYIVCSYPTHEQVGGACITVDPAGFRWVGAGTLSLPAAQIFLCHSDSTGAGWSDSLIMGPTGYVWLRDIVSDGYGNIWIAWCKGGVDSSFIYAAYIDSNYNWSIYHQITQATGEFYGWCRMTVDAENKLWIVYDKGNNFYYRVWDGVEWSPEDTIVGSPASAAFQGDIFYDHVRDRIWISFNSGTGYADDIYATWTNTAGGVHKYDNENIDEAFLIFPNPANNTITINAPSEGQKDIEIIDCLGCVVKNITSDEKVIIWDCTDNHARHVENGVYFIRLRTQDYKRTKKVTIFR